MGTFGSGMRYVYACVFIVLWLKAYKLFQRFSEAAFWSSWERQIAIAAALLVTVSFGVSLVLYKPAPLNDTKILNKREGSLPNILILSGDGINAGNMSAYGYKRETTPFINSLIAECLVFQNHFPNAARTTGSNASLLSGKLPLRTRVVFPPDKFTGIHMYRHFPGVLRQLGYTNADISVRHYVDAYDLNMRDAFDYANGRSIDGTGAGLYLPERVRTAYPFEALFLDTIYDRIASRIFHMFSLKTIINPYEIINHLSHTTRGTDSQRIDELIKFIDETSEPFFANVHLLGTHGSKFYPSQAVFSKSQEQVKNWMIDFYDDAIMDFDRNVKTVLQHLKTIGRYENTLIVINSDHGMAWATNRSIPLIIRFPTQQHIGLFRKNSQRIDIAPTILDFLGVDRPEWMEGISLLSGEHDVYRPIFAVDRKPSHEVNGWREVIDRSPPFYSLGAVSMVICNMWYGLDLKTGKVYVKKIGDNAQLCDKRRLPEKYEAKNMILETLKSYEYDVSLLMDKQVQMKSY